MLSKEKTDELQTPEQLEKHSSNILEIWKDPTKRRALILLTGAALDSVFGTMKDGVEAISMPHPQGAEVTITQPVDSSYLSADPLKNGAFVLPVKAHHNENHGNYYSGEGDTGKEAASEDSAKWLDIVKDPLPLDPASFPNLPEDFPIYKLPIPITENTPKDALQRDLASK